MEINAYIEEISDFLKEKMLPVFEEYGIELLNFYVNDISVPEEDIAVKKLKEALAKKAEMNIIGYSYQQERSFDTLESAAKNPGTPAHIMGAGLGLGMGLTFGEAVGHQFGGISNNLNTSDDKKSCQNCGAVIPKDKRFCPDCGFDTNKAKKENGVSAIVCSNCGFKSNSKSKFCPECGRKYNPCPKCSNDLPDGAAKCPSCGYSAASPCPHCGAKLPDMDIKFCPECGKPLIKTCPSCSSRIDGSPKFCPECGTKLDTN